MIDEAPLAGVRLVVLTGLAGVGKTELLDELSGIGEPVLDLERLAGHSGSAFGGLGRPPQPTRGSFLAHLNRVARALPRGAPAWVEDEGPFIGSLPVPTWLQRAMKDAPSVEVVAPETVRIGRLVASYGHLDVDSLVTATQRTRRRLGDRRADEAIERFRAGRPEAAIAVLLPYFDAAYAFRESRQARRRLGSVDSARGTRTSVVRRLLAVADRSAPPADACATDGPSAAG